MSPSPMTVSRRSKYPSGGCLDFYFFKGSVELGRRLLLSPPREERERESGGSTQKHTSTDNNLLSLGAHTTTKRSLTSIASLLRNQASKEKVGILIDIVAVPVL